MVGPMVSVVIPAYRAAVTIRATLESVLAQTRPADEILVIDDGSPDDLASAVAPYGDLVTLIRKPNGGVASTRNLGIVRSSGDLIAFVDADDVWHPRKLEYQLAVLEARPDLALLGSAIIDWPNEKFPRLEPIQQLTDLRLIEVPLSQLVVRNSIVTSSVIVRRVALDHVGEFDLGLHGPEDYDLWLRIAEVAPVGNMPYPLTGYRNVAGSLSKQAELMHEGMRDILSKLDARGSWRGNWVLRHKAYAYFHYSCAYMYAAAGRSREALWNAVLSFLWYPLTFQRSEVKMPLARLRLFARTFTRYLSSWVVDRFHAVDTTRQQHGSGRRPSRQQGASP